MEDQAEFIGKLTFVCSKHFSPTEFCLKPAGGRGLKKDAIPHLLEKSRLEFYYLLNETTEYISKLLTSWWNMQGNIFMTRHKTNFNIIWFLNIFFKPLLLMHLLSEKIECINRCCILYFWKHVLFTFINGMLWYDELFHSDILHNMYIICTLTWSTWVNMKWTQLLKSAFSD